MQFYNTTNTENSLVHECWKLCDADITSYPLADVTRRFNMALEELIGEIIVADGNYQYDDTNHTDLPVGIGNLVEGQQAYSFASEYLVIEGIDILNTSSQYIRIYPIDRNELSGMSVDEYFGVDSSGDPITGSPTHYDIKGDTIRLYPAPTATDVTLTSGIKIHFKRTADLFAVTDTTQEPGLPSPYHKILPYMAAIPYNESYHPQRVPIQERRVEILRSKMMEFFSLRDKDTRYVITGKRRAFK